MTVPGRIVVLNGAPRSGKSSIVAALQSDPNGIWINLGVDAHMAHMLPKRLLPGIGLRPGGERPDLEPVLPALYAALYESIAAHSRLGLDVVVDVGHHDDYGESLDMLADAARRLEGLPALLVGIRCPLDVIMERRRTSAGDRGYLVAEEDGGVPLPVRRWQEAVHRPGIYDLEVDTSVLSAEDCATRITARFESGLTHPTAFERLAAAPKRASRNDHIA
ncbi:MAG: chloramphenicol phosphotransferase [Rhizobiales bacterium]|nr:chloramphenicol phosphotransferase [Hyphomicrobiales bacterium]